MQELDRQIGKRLQQARKSSGFRSARAFARHYNIPESTYSQHETGKRSLNPKMVLYYSECFNVDPGWLVSGREVKPAADTVQLEAAQLNLIVFRRALQQTLQKFSTQQTIERIEEITNYCATIYRNVLTATEKLHANADSVTQ